MPENIIWDVCPASGGQHDSDEAVPMTGAGQFVVQTAVRDAVHGACPELFDGTDYADFPELVVANVMEALRALPVEDRMRAMGMRPLHSWSGHTDAWEEAR